MKTRYFYIKDIGCTIKVEQLTRKELLSWLDDYVDSVNQNNYYKRNMYYTEDDTYAILYKDGSFDYIDESYDGHKIKRINIASIVNSNPESYIVYGSFCINEYGVVTVSDVEQIDDTNIVEVDRFIA